MKKVLGTGLSGLVGSRIVELLSDKYLFENLSPQTGVDITDRERVTQAIGGSEAEIILHLAAKTDVDGCEKDKLLGKEGEAWKVNVLGTRNVIDACRKEGKKMVYISTDFVFDGEDPLPQGYSEEDRPHPINWYGQTKYEGEKIVGDSGLPFLILRLAYPYRAKFEPKLDFVRKIIDKLKKKEEVKAVSDHLMTPTFIDDIACGLDELIEQEMGIYHLVGSQFVSSYEVTLLIAKIFDLDSSLIIPTARALYFKNRAPRPFNLSLKNDRIQKLGIKMRTFEEGLEAIQKQLATSG